MAVCTLSNDEFQFTFRIDPTDVQWGYNLQMQEQLTVGGMVKYIMGVIIKDVTVTVEVGQGGIEEVQRIGDFVYAHMDHARKTGKTLRFQNYVFPWDLEVFIKDINGLHIDGVTKNYRLNLVMAVIKNNLELDTFEISDILGDLVEGITNIATIHTVTASDTLASIAERYYGDVNTGIAMINRIHDNESAFNPDGTPIPGAEITIPFLTRDPGGNLLIMQPGGESINPFDVTAGQESGVSGSWFSPSTYGALLERILPWAFGNKNSMATDGESPE